MKASLIIPAALVVLVAAVSAAAAREVGVRLLPPAAPAGETVLYGHIKSLTHQGSRFRLRFDPAWWLTGYAAQRAALEDHGSSDVPNDYYIVEEGHRLLTYLVSPTARVTVLTDGANATAITVAELTQLENGKNPNHRHLSEPAAGYWIRVGSKYPNPVLALDQQYQP